MPLIGGWPTQKTTTELAQSWGDSIMADKLLDTQGLACPLPILKTKKALRDMAAGHTLEVLATDPGSALDFEAFCKATGHTLLTSENNDGVFRFVIQHSAE